MTSEVGQHVIETHMNETGEIWHDVPQMIPQKDSAGILEEAELQMDPELTPTNNKPVRESKDNKTKKWPLEIPGNPQNGTIKGIPGLVDNHHFKLVSINDKKFKALCLRCPPEEVGTNCELQFKSKLKLSEAPEVGPS